MLDPYRTSIKEFYKSKSTAIKPNNNQSNQCSDRAKSVIKK